MIHLDEVKMRARLLYKKLEDVDPYDILTRVDILCSLKICSYQLGEFYCHRRTSNEQGILRKEVEEMYPSHIICVESLKIDHSHCSCGDYALDADLAKVSLTTETQPNVLLVEPGLQDAPADEAGAEPAVRDALDTSTQGETTANSVLRPIMDKIDVEVIACPVDRTRNCEFVEPQDDGWECSPPIDDLPAMTFVRALADEADYVSTVVNRSEEVARYYKYERGLGKLRVRYDMYRIKRYLVRYDNRGSELHIIRKEKEKSDNIYFEISDPHGLINSSAFQPWTNAIFPSTDDEMNLAAIIMRIQIDQRDANYKRRFHHRLKFLSTGNFGLDSNV